MKLERLLLPSEVCDLLQISKRTLQRMTSEGSIPHVPVRGQNRYRRADIDRIVGNGGVRDDELIGTLAEVRTPHDGFRCACEDWAIVRQELLHAGRRLFLFGGDDAEVKALREHIEGIDGVLRRLEPAAQEWSALDGDPARKPDTSE